MTNLDQCVVFVKSRQDADKIVNEFNSLKSDDMSKIAYRCFEPVAYFEILAKTTEQDSIKLNNFLVNAGFTWIYKYENLYDNRTK